MKKSDLPKETKCEPAPGADALNYEVCTTPDGQKWLCGLRGDEKGECESMKEAPLSVRIMEFGGIVAMVRVAMFVGRKPTAMKPQARTSNP